MKGDTHLTQIKTPLSTDKWGLFWGNLQNWVGLAAKLRTELSSAGFQANSLCAKDAAKATSTNSALTDMCNMSAAWNRSSSAICVVRLVTESPTSERMSKSATTSATGIGSGWINRVL